MFDPAFGQNVVRITLTKSSSSAFASNVRKALSAIEYTGFVYDMVDLAEKDGTSVSIPSGPAFGQSKLLEAIDLLTFSFDEFSCRYNGGYVYEWEDASTVTFKKKGNLRQYLGELCRRSQYREVMTNQLNTLVSFFENNPDYQGIDKLKIDLNIIEVSNTIISSFFFFLVNPHCIFLSIFLIYFLFIII